MSTIGEGARAEHRRWLLELTSLPTASGREDRVVEWVRAWIGTRPGVSVREDAAGNMVIGCSGAMPSSGPPAAGHLLPKGEGGSRPLYITAHLDHPAFVVTEVEDARTVRAEFRGGVRARYFDGERVTLHAADGAVVGGVIASHADPAPPERLYRTCAIALDEPARGARVGDVATWELPTARVDEAGLVHAPACDDLAAVAAALAAFDELMRRGAAGNVRVLLTVAEEVGFVGAIAACREGTIERGARVIALENSRSFAESPIGGGPIVRVGDRLSVFSPGLTAAVARVCETLAGTAEVKVGAPAPVGAKSKFKWQRKLMAGGACEATAYCAWGYEATCVCLALGNYHNMGRLEEVEREGFTGEARIAPEVIALSDFEGLVELLVACGVGLGSGEDLRARLEKMYEERKGVIEGGQ